MIQTMRRLLVVFMLCVPFAHAIELPPPANVSIEGNVLSWDAVEGATGYNIYLGNGYFTTVKGSRQYSLTQAGTYRIVAFDDNGNFGINYGPNPAVEYAGTGTDDSISVTNGYNTSIVQVRCLNVGPGESCIASCDSTQTQSGGSVYTRYMSGGGCATSDIVEADAFISTRSYQCTVPTFSGEVIAQAICVH